MTKRVQYAQSLPLLPAAPAPESDRAVLYAKADGLFVRLADGLEVGPLAAAAAGGAGLIPSARVALPTPSSVVMGTTGQAGTFEDVPGLHGVTVTSTAAAPLFALANLAVSTVSGNNSVEVGVRVVLDSVPEQIGNATRVIIPRSAELNAASPSLLTSALPAGTYTARVQWRRVTGTLIPEITTGSLFLQAQQAPAGPEGPRGPSGGSGIPQQLEVDFGVRAVDEKVMTVAAPGVAAGRPLMIEQSGDAATGRDPDENELEQFEVNGRTLANALVLNFNALSGSRLQGRFKVNYMVG